MTSVTIVGVRGFIGSALADMARGSGIVVRGLRRAELPVDEHLGTVIYCSGITWGSDMRPVEAYDAHVAQLVRLVESAKYDRLVYLSSTRVYGSGAATGEDAALTIQPQASADTYPLSKIAGEGLVLAASDRNRVVRLSNVFGFGMRSEIFLSDVLRQAVRRDRIALRSSLASAKDYVGIRDAATSVLRIAESSECRIYNVAAGRNTTHGELVETIRRVRPVAVDVPVDAPTKIALPIDVTRLQSEFPFGAEAVCDAVPNLLRLFGSGLSG